MGRQAMRAPAAKAAAAAATALVARGSRSLSQRMSAGRRASSARGHPSPRASRAARPIGSLAMPMVAHPSSWAHRRRRRKAGRRTPLRPKKRMRARPHPTAAHTHRVGWVGCGGTRAHAGTSAPASTRIQPELARKSRGRGVVGGWGGMGVGRAPRTLRLPLQVLVLDGARQVQPVDRARAVPAAVAAAAAGGRGRLRRLGGGLGRLHARHPRAHGARAGGRRATAAGRRRTLTGTPAAAQPRAPRTKTTEQNPQNPQHSANSDALPGTNARSSRIDGAQNERGAARAQKKKKEKRSHRVASRGAFSDTNKNKNQNQK